MLDLREPATQKTVKILCDRKLEERQNENLKVLHPVNEGRRREMDYKTYCLCEKSQVYDGLVRKQVRNGPADCKYRIKPSCMVI